MIQDEKSITTYSLNKKLNQWVQRQFKKMSALEGNKEAIPETFSEAMK